jgi:hypothetical protein
MQNRNKVPVAVRLTPAARELMVTMAEKLGLSQAGVLELALRKLAQAEGIKTEEDKING